MMMPLPSTPPACHAQDTLAQARLASGGRAWAGIVQTTALGAVTVAGLRGSARVDADLRGGRYARRFDVPAMGSTAEVYDGATIWAQDISGGVHPYNTPFARARAATSAYLTQQGFFNTRTAAAFTCFGTRVEAGHRVTLIRVQPQGGIPADLAIDEQTHLLASISERFPLPSDDSVMRFADYRRVAGLTLPFSIDVGTQSAPTDGYAFDVSRYVLLPRVDANFAKPIAEDTVRMSGGATATTVPMNLEGRQLLIWASIDGHAPLPFILDTGGHAILTTQAAKALGLRAQGAGVSGGSGAGTISTQYTHVKSVRIGSAELRNQSFLVIPYPYSFYERGTKTPLAGILGLEVFERFATRLDYGDRTVTLTPFSNFHHNTRASAIPLMFEDQEDMPVVEGATDGATGLVGTDTGNAGVLILFGPFLQRTGLLARYTGGTKTIGQGTGGSNAGRLVTLQQFSLGVHTLRNVLTNFTHMTSGSFSSRTEAGNVGFSVLSRFIPTFDYASNTLYLDPQRHATPFGRNGSGLGFAKNVPTAFDVVLVRPGSAAASAGIVPGDRIVAVNGRSATEYSWADLTTLAAQATGTKLSLRIAHGSAQRDVVIRLR